MQIPAQSKPLTPMQLDLLGLFSRNIPEHQLQEIKAILAKYFAQKASEEMDEFLAEGNVDVDKWTDNILNEHLRTPYTPKSPTNFHKD